ncbi:sulfite exporter TauE/SafE family protein [Paucibacter sp. DJ2R-2]|uniref:sulfite exporter TauE/SafE family protein n=1 Tax=Paucibacter sp. DJ2R-2 TaxID=2893558 RepID=UPI0021E478D3|nr:sulfite exporter TauE/SafE family protein [Paucibacter sp. DJ2R-2]MCV2422831.1 sulfite exporter TauE/SafE family protein [Paucibacter sp. DJ4R-1]MCV2441028.1 sulfite exporter TauE/SafE family protein [Paucibacter sp. DJ2R-2]
MDWLAVASGFGVGAIVGVTGVGGGSLMTPLLLSVFRLSPAVAIGTDLWFAALTKMSGSVAHSRHGHVKWGLTALLLAGSIPASIATVALMHATDITKGWASTLTFSLGIALFLTALVVAFKKSWQAVGLHLERHIPESRKPALTVAAGVLLGVLVSLSSIGAGAIGATLILLIYPRLEARYIVGSDIAHAVPLTLVAGIGHATLGHVNWTLLLPLLIGSMPGIWLGAQLTRRLPDGVVRGLLCGSLLLAGWKVIH